ncbi:MAG TPA: hypothetical protein VK974_07190 [Methylophilaceae bacterium]|nr:hypothetical protein [Methylophilaceae bacterium]
MKFLLNVLFVFLTLMGFVSGNAFAVGPDFTTLTTGVDFSTIGPALLLIAVAISGVYVIWKGAKMILAAIKSA